MKDENFDNAFVNTVSAVEFTTVHRLAKKGLRVRLDISSPKATAKAWDRCGSKKRGFAKMDRLQEEHISREIINTAEYRKSLPAVIECERANGVAELVKGFERRMFRMLEMEGQEV